MNGTETSKHTPISQAVNGTLVGNRVLQINSGTDLRMKLSQMMQWQVSLRGDTEEKPTEMKEDTAGVQLQPEESGGGHEGVSVSLL